MLLLLHQLIGLFFIQRSKVINNEMHRGKCRLSNIERETVTFYGL